MKPKQLTWTFALSSIAAVCAVVLEYGVDRFALHSLNTFTPVTTVAIALIVGGPIVYMLVGQRIDATATRDMLAHTARQAEALGDTLEKSHRLALMAEELAGVGNWRLETSTGQVTWSDGVFKIFGLETMSNEPARGLDLVDPADREHVGALVAKALKDGAPYRFQTKISRPSGEVRHIVVHGAASTDKSGKVETLFGVIIDATEDRAREQALADSEAKYRLLAENATDVIATCDLDGRVTYLSPSGERLYGYTQAELLGGDAVNLIHPDDQDMVTSRLRELIVNRRLGLSIRYEYRAITKSGRVIWIEANPSVVLDPLTGRVVAFQDCLREITERKLMEAELVRKRAEAEAAAVAKSEFLANMSHEIRTPLTGILGFAGLLGASPDLPDKARTYVSRIASSGQMLLSVVNDILDFSKLDAERIELDPHPFDPRALVSEAIDMVGVEAQRKGLAVSATVEGELPAAVDADSSRVRQVLLNLLSNAVKFTETGAVTVTARYLADQGRLRIAVGDTGVGIPKDRLDRLFQRFSQVDGSTTREYGGTGLGLAICKGLVEMMGGEIGVESAEGAGSTFWFTVAAPAAAGAGPAAPAEARASAPAARRILIVDDVAMNRELMSEMLGPLGAEVSEAGDGLMAVAAAMRARFDLILMDLQMPGMDGYAAARAIRANSELNSATPIVGVSANVLPKHIEACREAGMNDYISKPIDPADLMAKVAQLAPAALA